MRGAGWTSRAAVAAALRILILTWRDGDHPEAGGAEVYVERTSQILVRTATR